MRADLGVRLALRRHQHQLGSLHLQMRPRVAGRHVLKLGPLGIAQDHLIRAAAGHRQTDSPPARPPLHKREGIYGGQD
jgi:hypothetical protein